MPTLFERCRELHALHMSIYRTSIALETLAPPEEKLYIATAGNCSPIHFDPLPYQTHESECVRQLAANLSTLVHAYNAKGLETN